jgi:phosphopantetheinyl transferase (holo-ACP synthase)
LVCHINRRTELRLFKDRLLRKILQPKREEVIKDRRKMHNKKLHDLYFLLKTSWAAKEASDGLGMWLE